ncbi:MAG: hypothetical protein QM731_04385 [Chitinophagaceae bacterium]
MEQLPLLISIAFILTTVFTILLFWKSAGYSSVTIIVLAAWLLLQAIVSLNGFYKVTDTVPPRFPLLVIPPLLLIMILFVSKPGRRYLDRMDATMLTLLHVIRIPVEFILWWVFLHKAVPQLMTFEGRNFDIFAGITAPFVCYFGLIKQKLGRQFLLWWNIICIGLLLNIVINAVLSAPTPFQQFAFDQPNIALLYFPFVWLPSCIVPLVLLSHLVVIRQLVKAGKRA